MAEVIKYDCPLAWTERGIEDVTKPSALKGEKRVFLVLCDISKKFV